MSTIYVLLCDKQKYYIGKTDRRIKERVKEHFNNHGSEWTRLYKPIKIIDIKQNADDFDEDKYTKIYMKKYGIDNVRGGSYTQIELPEYCRLALEKELCTASNKCFRCNRLGHFANECYAKTKSDGTYIDDENDDSSSWETVSESDYYCCEYCNKEFETEYEALIHEQKCKNKVVENKPQVCYRCGRKGHNATSCFAHSHINGKPL